MTNSTHHSSPQPDSGDALVARGQLRKVLPRESELVARHFLRLDADSRRKRFSREVPDAYIDRYAADILDIGNLAFGFFIDGEIRALAELKRPGLGWGATAEAAFSVEKPLANHGLATRMMGLIIRSARNRGVRHLMLYCMADNAKMRAIARYWDAELTIEPGSVIADILPGKANYRSWRSEFVEDRISALQSIIDFQTKFVRASRLK